jgi:hypothetical protein
VLASLGCSTQAAPVTVGVYVNLRRGDRFAAGRVWAELPDRAVVDSARVGGNGVSIALTVRSGNTYTFRGVADGGKTCGPSTLVLPRLKRAPFVPTPPYAVTVRCS